LRIIFMGTPDFAVFPLESLLLSRYEVVAVYTPPGRPVGRGRSLVPSPVKQTAQAWNLSLVQPSSLKDAAAVAQLAAFKPDVIVVAAYGQILTQAVLDLPALGCVNIHPSLLPRHRGASPVAASILAGDEFSGVSIMRMDAGLDTGPVLLRAPVAIAPYDTTSSLTTKLSLVASRLLLEVLVRLPRGEITPQPQNEAEATYSGTLSKQDGEIDWHLPAVVLGRRVRAFQPWPGCYTRWQGRRLEIVRAVPLLGMDALEVGRVVALGRKDAAFGIGTGDGVLGVMEVQLEGKRAMPAAEFLRGQRQIIGAVLLD